MKTSDNIDEIMKAIQAVQQTVPPIEKTAQGSTGQRAYGYTPLDGIWEKISAAMKTNNLVVVASPTTGQNYVGKLFQTTLYHTASGQYITETMDMTVAKDDPQGIGSAITYYRRYMLVSMLGLHVRGSDNDASEHKLATAQQKARIVGTVKQVFPDMTDQNEIIKTVQNIVGKHPSYIREDEAEGAITMISAFLGKDKKTGDEHFTVNGVPV